MTHEEWIRMQAWQRARAELIIMQYTVSSTAKAGSREMIMYEEVQAAINKLDDIMA